MPVLLSLFFISLVGIVFMIGRKIALLKTKNTTGEEVVNDTILDMPYMDEIKYVTVKKIKEYGYVILLSSIRLSMKSSRLMKKTSSQIVGIIKNKLNNGRSEGNDPKEVSKFLQLVSEYKHKIKKIKHKIREEEGIE